MKSFIKAILAGIIISVAGFTYLLAEDKVLGAALFSIALYTILAFDFDLFTGKVGYIFQKDLKYFGRVLMIIVGNVIGTVGTSTIIQFTRLASKLEEKAIYYADMKLSDDILSVFILSIFCGILMYIAVHGFKTIKHEIGKYVIVILAILTFILNGFEHSIANTVYITISKMWSLEVLGYLGVMLLGNGIGAIVIASLDKLKQDNIIVEEEKESKIEEKQIEEKQIEEKQIEEK